MPISDGELSVFRIQGLLEDDVWETGKIYVSEPQGKTLYARGDVMASVVFNSNLTIVPDDKPPRHANIVDWPVDKDAQKLIALELANQAILCIYVD